MDDLLIKYPSMEPAAVKQLFELNDRDVLRTDFELKELAFEPTATSTLSKNSNSEQKKSNIDSEEEEEEDFKESPKQLNKKSVSHQLSTEENNEGQQPQLSEKQIGEMVGDFQEHHKDQKISKAELDSIVDVIREGQKGVNYSEERFLKAQFANDLIRLQTFIEMKTRQIIEESYVQGGVNIYNREEFPTFNDGMDEKKSKPKKYNPKKGKKDHNKKIEEDEKIPDLKPVAQPQPHILDELVADKRAMDELTKTDELVTVKLDGPSEFTFALETDQPLTKWAMFEDNLFVMGDVTAPYLVYPTRKLLQTPQPVSWDHVQQTQILLQ